MLSKLRDVFGVSDQSECAHATTGSVAPTEEDDIWHLEKTVTGDEYWSETDAAFVKLRRTRKALRCLGCGEERTVMSGERVGTVKWKSEMDPDERKKMKMDVTCGTWYNGRLWFESRVLDDE